MPAPFAARPATSADIASIASVLNECERAYCPEPLTLEEADVRLALDRSDSAVLVETAGGRAVACSIATHRGEALRTDFGVRPGSDPAIAAFLLDWLERRAREVGAEKARVAALEGDEAGQALLGQCGYTYVRSFYRMVIDLAGSPTPPSWPVGLAVSALRLGEEHVLYEVCEEAFAEHWGHARRTFEEWSRGPQLEPDLVFIARDGDQPAGAVICYEDRYGVALVDTLGVRKPWRGRGLGRALLLQGFSALYERGRRRIGLGVDAGNETGAVQLYESVGMRVGGREDAYEKRV